MCIFLNNVETTGTTILSVVLKNSKHGFVYKNTALGTKGTMVLPIPSKGGSVFKNGKPLNSMMDAMYDEILARNSPKTRGVFEDPDGKSKKEIVIKKVGIYNTAIVKQDQLEEAYTILDIPKDDNMLKFLGEQYAEWEFLTCNWNTGKKLVAQPLWVEYDPIYKNALYIPLMEGHGEVPKDEDVAKDVIIGVYYEGMVFDNTVESQNCKYVIPNLPNSLKISDNTIFATRLEGELPNGDAWMDISKKNPYYSFYGDDDQSYLGFERSLPFFQCMRMIYVSGDGDFSAIHFEQKFSGQLVSNIIKEIFNNSSIFTFENEEGDKITCKLFNYTDIDSRFIEFIRNSMLDYDNSKHKNFYFEDETIKNIKV